MRFVREFTQANQGKAFYTGIKGLGEMIFEDYETNRKKRIRGSQKEDIRSEILDIRRKKESRTKNQDKRKI